MERCSLVLHPEKFLLYFSAKTGDKGWISKLGLMAGIRVVMMAPLS